MLNDRTSALSLLQTRRSGRPRDLVEPGPDATQLREILAIAARTPDHGKLAPWRFVHIRKEDRDAFGSLLEQVYRSENTDPGRLEIEAVHRFAQQAPTLIVALSSPIQESKIPIWEQQLSCGAACMNLLLAAHAMGFAAGWVTGWAAYSPGILAIFGREHERIAGFIFIGTPASPVEERPRPALDFVLSEWLPGV